MTHNNTTPTQTQQNITHTHTHIHKNTTQHNVPSLPLLSAFDNPSLSFRMPRVAQGVSIADPEPLFDAAVLDGAVEGRAASIQMLRDNRPGRSTAAQTLAEVYSTHLQGIGCVANFLPIPCP